MSNSDTDGSKLFPDDELAGLNQNTGHTTTLKKPERKIHPEEVKLDELYSKLYNANEGLYLFWTINRRVTLYEVSQRVFAACGIAGIVLCMLSSIWYILLGKAKVVYYINMTKHDPTTGLATAKTVDLKMSYLEIVKFANDAFTFYFLGALLLSMGSGFAVISMDQPYRFRLYRYCCSIVLSVSSIYFIIVGPFFPMTADNNAEELKILKNDEFMAYHNSTMGSLKYYRNGQCKHIHNVTMGKSKEMANQMKDFCKILKRLELVFYVMWASIAFPVLSFTLATLQIIVNNRYWNMRKLKRYKPRTPEQCEADKCTLD